MSTQSTEPVSAAQAAHLADLETRAGILEEADSRDPETRPDRGDRLENLEAQVDALDARDAVLVAARDTPLGRGEVDAAGWPLPQASDGMRIDDAGQPLADQHADTEAPFSMVETVTDTSQAERFPEQGAPPATQPTETDSAGQPSAEPDPTPGVDPNADAAEAEAIDPGH